MIRISNRYRNRQVQGYAKDVARGMVEPGPFARVPRRGGMDRRAAALRLRRPHFKWTAQGDSGQSDGCFSRANSRNLRPARSSKWNNSRVDPRQTHHAWFFRRPSPGGPAAASKLVGQLGLVGKANSGVKMRQFCQIDRFGKASARVLSASIPLDSTEVMKYDGVTVTLKTVV